MSATITLRLEDAVKSKLEQLAEATHRSKSFLAAEAIKAYVDTNDWQISEIQDAIREADAGDFATEAEVQAVFNRWKSRETAVR